jgi:hypothetical protein
LSFENPVNNLLAEEDEPPPRARPYVGQARWQIPLPDSPDRTAEKYRHVLNVERSA